MKKNKRSNKTKTRSTVVGLGLVGAILVGGTFAFSQLNQQAITPDWHEAFGGGGRIHNISQANGDADFGIDGERNHDIFAENFSDIPLGVRVQLREFLRVNGEEIDDNMDLTDFDTWSLFLADENLDRTGLSAEIEDAGISWTLGQESDLKVFMPTFNQINRSLNTDELIGVGMTGEDSIFNSEVAYRFVDTAGRSIAVYADGLVIDVDHVQEIEGAQTAQGNHNGLQNFWNLGDYYEGTLYTVESGQLVRTEDVTHEAQATLAADEGGIMTLSQWRELDAADQAGNFWIFDDLTEEGWFFWNGFIPAGEATSLLLDAVFLTGTDNLEYVIHVTADFFSTHTLDDAEIHPELRPRFTDVEPAPTSMFPLAANECLQDNPGGIRPANIFVDETGFEWCVVATEGNYSMLVARHTIQNDRIDNNTTILQRNNTEGFVPWPANTSLAGGPEARERMYTWWNRNDQVSPVLRAQAVHAYIPTRFTEPGTPTSERGQDTLITSLSMPRVGSSALGANPVFFLNEAEVNVRLGQTDDISRITNRIAYDGTVGTTSFFWLRSAASAGEGAIVNSLGDWAISGVAAVNPALAFRPAVWVRRTPAVNDSTAERIVIPASIIDQYATEVARGAYDELVISILREGLVLHNARGEVYIDDEWFNFEILEIDEVASGTYLSEVTGSIPREGVDIYLSVGPMEQLETLTIRITAPSAENYIDVVINITGPTRYWFERDGAVVPNIPRGSQFSVGWRLMHFNGSEIINLTYQSPFNGHGWSLQELETNPHMTLHSRGAPGGTFNLSSDAPLGRHEFTIFVNPTTPTTALSVPQSEWPTYTIVINVTP